MECWVLGAGGVSVWETENQFGIMKRVLEMDGGDGCASNCECT